jgi:hypothetical protein
MDVVTQIGSEHMVQTISNNRANYKKAYRMIVTKHPSIMW